MMDRRALKNLALLRFPVMLLAMSAMLVVTIGNISGIADGLGMHLFNSARYEEATRLEMELSDLLVKAHRYSYGDRDIRRRDVDVALDIFWSRTNVVATPNYQKALRDANIMDAKVAVEMKARLPEFEAAIAKLTPGDRVSLRPLLALIREFQTRVNDMSSDAYLARRFQMQKMIERELHSLDSLKSMQSQFAGLVGFLVLFVIFELFISQRVNVRLKRAMAEKEALLVTDGLTGIGNRRGFETELASRPPFSEFSLLLVDLDSFKEVNDTMGHPAGDALLRHVAAALAANAAPLGGVVARLGGDEFAVLLKGSRHRAMDYADAALKDIARQISVEGKSLQVTASIGLAHSSDARDNALFAETLMKHADLALYSAKAEGRNCARFTTAEMIADSARKRCLARDLVTAIADGDLEAAFQPIVSLKTGETHSVETLVRWTHPRFGAIAAPDIVQAAEGANLILPMTLVMLDRACVLRAQLALSGDAPRMAVNLSPALLSMPDLAGSITGVLAKRKCPTESIILELTEDAAMSLSETVVENLEALRAAGVRLSVDDFGAGYSNLSRLAELEFAQIKIDKSLIRRIVVCNRTYDIVRHITRMAGDLGMEVVAEGVETEADRAVLLGLGAPFGQGYHFARPMSDLSLMAWLGERRADRPGPRLLSG
ncbi:diguanylate cyclase (GGDEF)-like protein [Rhizobium sp. SG_E_25_P2]|uniref:putative bifunctional diguanylate cyclase/phosphodiesterase n=1 Tax=Rhizobium sp. SG_E_25_P2 TaxID=2879942 RepID=UPI002475191C|nr:bifunctional diguanylate cyclase/phosphodiesterase [Rhizobium sp. SG_E_25_P2]MDH6267317.1 diguanylate cyclase (GGDEF)-like protein [Rhizobium sp. SG_E_25_P2]